MSPWAFFVYARFMTSAQCMFEVCDNQRTMDNKRNILSIVLTALVAVGLVAVIVQAVVLGNSSKKLEDANAQLSSLDAQVDEATTTNTQLKSQSEENLLEWRNAQGRMSFMGDKSGLVAYLTFDDGPCSNTSKVLDILDQYDACGTWFCLANDKDQDYLQLDLCKEIEERGNAVGIHDWEQNESYDYYKGTVDNYFDTDFNKTKEKLEAAVGHEIKIMRFAGGSPTIAYYNSKIGKTLPQEIIKRGYQYFDWNVLAGDSEPSQFVNGSTPKDKIVSNVLGEAKTFAKTNSPICVLMHDNPGKDTTIEALPEIIQGLKKLGYSFKTLSYDSPGFYQAKIID